MVLTRGQLKKQKAEASPDNSPAKPASKQPRKKDGAAAADVEEQVQQKQQPAGRPRLAVKAGLMGAVASMLAGGGPGPVSHPIHSLPTSPVEGPLGVSDFHIPAAPAGGTGPPVAAACEPEASAPLVATATDQADAVSVQPITVAAAVGGPASASEEAEVVSARHTRAEQQQQEAAAAPARPRPISRDDKPLKPLPDKPVACDKLPDGPEPVVVEVEYVTRDSLQALDDPAAVLDATLAGLESSDWVEGIRALNVLRQLVVHHADVAAPHLASAVPAVLKGVKSLRSSLCKTAIMAVADLYLSYGDVLLPHTDVGGEAKPATSLLAQLLLKAASNDKKFVVEEAQRALQTLADSLSAPQVLPLLLPYAEHKNPKVRAKAAVAVDSALSRMQPTEVAAAGLPRLLRTTARLLTDNTPEAREAAKRLVGLLRGAFEDAGVQQQLDVQVPQPEATEAGEEAPPPPTKWEFYCQQTLGGSAALTVLKATSVDC